MVVLRRRDEKYDHFLEERRTADSNGLDGNFFCPKNYSFSRLHFYSFLGQFLVAALNQAFIEEKKSGKDLSIPGISALFFKVVIFYSLFFSDIDR